MISWKHSFKNLNEEYEIARKKKQALDNLLNAGRISQPTHDLFYKEIDDGIAEIERQQKVLMEKMNCKMMELEEQIKTLEMLFANFEIQHVAGEVDEEVYQREIGLLSTGLESARQELGAVKEAVNQLSNLTEVPATDTGLKEEIEPQPSENIEVSKTEVKVAEEPVPVVEVSEKDSSQAPPEQPQETLQGKEESQPSETKTEDEQKQQT